MASLLLLLFMIILGEVRGDDVTYDARSLIINGERKILFSGSIHYPRSTPEVLRSISGCISFRPPQISICDGEMWPSLIANAKAGGLDVIQTYVFWNLHEPQQGQYDFSGRGDLVRFIKEIQAQGLYVCLRIGPFIEAEWTYGGFPVWLRNIPNIAFRTDNEPFKAHMENFTSLIVNMMKEENLYAPQGGPIIISQIENEYGNIEAAYHSQGPAYVHWAAAMAVGLQTGVPWVMCKQDDAPDPVINTCNGMRCGETFKGPNSPNKPSMWTENWTSFLQSYGDQPYMRSPQVIAFHVALFIAKSGSFVNYYMYHGGTNFGRTAASYMITSYYDQAPIDEYGLLRQPKWGHLKDLHSVVKSCSEALLSGVPTHLILGTSKEAYVFQGESGNCVAFLMNNASRVATVLFQNVSYVLPAKSISILPDCKTEAFNTAKVNAVSTKRFTTKSAIFNSNAKWKEFRDNIPGYDDTTLQSNTLLDQISTTNDTTDYLWYTLSFQNTDPDTPATLQVTSMGHCLRAFVNGAYVGSIHGSRTNSSFTLRSTISLNSGTNNISLLSAMVGLPDSGAHLERRIAGLRGVNILMNQKTMDFTNYAWGYQVGLKGEDLNAFSDEATEVEWEDFSSSFQPLTWYKTTFDAPQGNDPLLLNLPSMGKGEAWVNGQSIGRYWVSFLTFAGRPAQTWFHIPRSFLKPTGNSLVLLEEENGDPRKISIDKVTVRPARPRLSNISSPPPSPSNVYSNKCEEYKQNNKRPLVQLKCPPNKRQSRILIERNGNHSRDYESYAIRDFNSTNSKTMVAKFS